MNRIDHFTVVCSVTWPLNGSEAGGDLVLIKTSLSLSCRSSYSYANCFHLHKKSREVCIKARSPPASLAVTGQVTKHATVKWPILSILSFFDVCSADCRYNLLGAMMARSIEQQKQDSHVYRRNRTFPLILKGAASQFAQIEKFSF